MCDKTHYDELETRVTQLEASVAELRSETRTGLASVNGAINTLSVQLANLDKRIIEEKQKWGETLRGIVKWTVRALLAVATYAAGVNVTAGLIK